MRTRSLASNLLIARPSLCGRPPGLTSPSNMNIAQPAQAARTIEDRACPSCSAFSARPGSAPALEPLYRAIVAAARDPAWYRDGGVPDTIDGRFDMIAAVTALGPAPARGGRRGRAASRRCCSPSCSSTTWTRRLRQIGIGDYVVGKHVGRMMGALGGRLAAFRDGADAAAISPTRCGATSSTRRRRRTTALALVAGAARARSRRRSTRLPLDALLAGRAAAP